MSNYIDMQQRYEFDVYPKRDLTIVRGEGSKLYDENGNEYIDCTAGIGVANIGHSNNYLADRVSEQIRRLTVNPGIFYNDVKALFLEKLHLFAPNYLRKTFLCNSGTEAIESAIKFARFNTGKTDFICAMKSFHGRTLGALSATFKNEYKKDFQPLVPGFKFAPLNKYERFEELVDNNTAGVILELIQGEGGINIAEVEFVRKIRKMCDDKKLLLIIDEIQTGVGRTGKFLSIEHYNVKSDILCMAKALGGGIPIGAVLCGDNIETPKGKHGSTFGGNPIACSAGLAVLEIIEQNNLIDEARAKGEYLLSNIKLIDSNLIRTVRGAGLMIGLELKVKVRPILLQMMENGILALSAGSTVIRLLPPLSISYAEIDEVLRVLNKILA